MSREKIHSPNSQFGTTRPRHVDSLLLQSFAVVRPTVSRRTCFVLVGPTRSPDTPRSMVSTLPSRSLNRSAASSPRRAPESAARRTSSRICSALCRTFREPADPSNAAAAFSTHAMDHACLAADFYRWSIRTAPTPPPTGGHGSVLRPPNPWLRLPPSGHCHPHHLRPNRRDSAVGDGVSDECLDIRASRGPCRGSPVVPGDQPPLK
jgi:hypothetical protein